MRTVEQGVVYECGCDALVVGQSFHTGLLVCPVHRVPVAPWDRPEQPERHSVVISIDLETQAGHGRAFVDWLDRVLANDGRVRSMTITIEDRP
jgi:hypothetical protein